MIRMQDLVSDSAQSMIVRVSRATRQQLERLKQRIAKIDGPAVDELYGLEPVFEPGAVQAAALGEFVELQCPWCGEAYGSQVDLTDRSRCYIEDCQVCCQPIEITLDVNEDGVLLNVQTTRLD
jgi:hypothetical protein